MPGIIDKSQLQRYFKLSPDKYKKFTLEGIGVQSDLFKGLYGGFILGKEKFIRTTLDTLKEKVETGDFSYKKTVCGLDSQTVIQTVAEYYKKGPDVLRKARKKPLLAKKIAVYLLKKLTALTNKEIGDEFGISYSGVSWIARDVDKLIGKDEGVKSDIEKLNSQLKV